MRSFNAFKLILFTEFFVVIVYITIRILINNDSVKDYRRSIADEFRKKPLTIHCNGGRLGNQMSTYATLYGIARHNNRSPHGQLCNMKHLTPYFNLTAKVIPDMAKEDIVGYDIEDYLREQDLRIPLRFNMLTGFLFARSFTFYHRFKDEILKEFSFKENIAFYAKNVLRHLNKNHNYKVYVGMHIRRTDFCNVLRRYHARSFDMKYLIKAMDYFKRKYANVIFVVVSDDRRWCRRNLGRIKDVVIAPDPPEDVYDIAILAQCNHTIVTYGSYGYWGAYLANGETVYFKDNYAPDSPLFKRFKRTGKNDFSKPPDWIGISTTPKEYWKIHKWDEC